MQYEDLTQELVDRCLSRGADSAEVMLETGRRLSIEVRNGEMETIQESSSHGAGFRVFRMIVHWRLRTRIECVRN